MDTRFVLVPIAVLSIAQVSQASVFLSVQQAQAIMFPGATFTADFRTLTRAEISAIEKASGTNVLNKQIRVWKVSTGGWFIADQVIGKHDYIPFAVALDESGAVKDVEILEYREAYGGEVKSDKWRAQFVGKNHDSALKLTDDIQNISGATLSSKHITDGVRRLVATYAIVLASS
jgi:Na+-translocating ferredoxin:NAD+ oxidoreductase RnfG subunit